MDLMSFKVTFLFKAKSQNTLLKGKSSILSSIIVLATKMPSILKTSIGFYVLNLDIFEPFYFGGDL